MRSYRCKQCRDKHPVDSEIIMQEVHRFCSKLCRRKFTAQKKAKLVQKEKLRKQKKREKKANSVSVLKKKLWTIISEYIRLRDSDDDNTCLCVTCPPGTPRRHYKDSIQAGHYIASGQSSYHRYNEKNIHPQCYGCNVGKGGNVLVYREYMIKRYGQEYTDWLYDTRNELTKLGAEQLKNLIQQYTKLLSDVKMNKALD